MSIYEALGIGYVIFAVALFTIAFVYCAVIGLCTTIARAVEPEPAILVVQKRDRLNVPGVAEVN